MDLLELHPQGSIGIVTRRVDRTPDIVDLVLSTAAPAVIGSSPVVIPFRPVPAELRSWGWRARLRLRWARLALAHEPLVAVELSAWSTTMTELRLAPVAPESLHWGDRRWGRYFDLAHATADALVAHLTSTPTGLPTSPPLVSTQAWR